MKYLPIFVDVRDRDCLVVGGGAVAERKVRSLLRCGARVTVVAPEVVEGLSALLKADAARHIAKAFEPNDISGFGLAIAATDSEPVNRSVAETAGRLGVLVNVVDRPELSTFIFPAVVDRSPVIAAVSTGGASPVLARAIRAQIEKSVPTGMAALAQLAERFRPEVRARIPDASQRRRFWERIVTGPVADLAASGQEDAAVRRLNSLLDLESRLPRVDAVGMVSLVGAGPGDPDLLTIRAFRLIQTADVVVYDRLVSSEILSLVRLDAERIYAGKEASRHVLPQERINALLVRLAKAGKQVVRLKGGDPFIFGRGGEEIETLMAEGIPFQVVPGITAASGCASYAGIPLTHRDYAQSVTFVTGHLRNGEISSLEWERLVRAGHTLVVYMGLLGLPAICEALIANGCPPCKPAALIERGTLQHQRVIVGTVQTLPRQVAEQGVSAPTLVIVGDVVRLHEKLRWFHAEQKCGAAAGADEGA